MDMFDRDNELSMLIIKQFATEDKCNHYFWLHIMHGVIKGTYENFSQAILKLVVYQVILMKNIKS